MVIAAPRFIMHPNAIGIRQSEEAGMPSERIGSGGQMNWALGQNAGSQVGDSLREPWATSPAVQAAAKMKAKWVEMGGPSSDLGLPKDRELIVTERNGAFVCDFRGGQMVMDHDPGEIVVNTSNRVAVVFEGFGLEQRQESGDEIFGSIHGRLGSLGYIKDFAIPEVPLGPDGANRIAQLGITIYEGPPADLNVVLYLIEHDSGDRKKVREEIRKHVQKSFETAGSAIGGVAGVPVGSFFDAEKSSEASLQKLVIEGATELIDKILGMGDDPYNQVGFTISSDMMLHPGHAQNYRCSSDPRSLKFTNDLKFTTTSRDDGGDLGQISALFSIQRR